jgi:hypothetical protein
MAGPAVKSQTEEDRRYILANLPEGVRRVQVQTSKGKIEYKRPEDVLPEEDEIKLASDGTPICMRGKPGPKFKTRLNPVTPQIAEVEIAREDHLSSEPILREISKASDADDAFEAVLKGMAREAAVVEFERMEAQRHGRDSTNHSTKRARVLKAMADLMLKKRQISDGGGIDLDSPQYKALFVLTLETFKGAMKESGCRPELVETVFTNLVQTLDEDWNQDARRRMKDASK